MFNVPFRLVFSLLDCLCLAWCCRCRCLSLVNVAAAGAGVSPRADGKLSASPSGFRVWTNLSVLGEGEETVRPGRRRREHRHFYLHSSRIGISSAQYSKEVAPVVPYRDLATTGFPQSPTSDPVTSPDNPEKGLRKRSIFKWSASSSISARSGEPGAIRSSGTPFHFELKSVGRAAELGAMKVDSARPSEDASVGRHHCHTE